VKWCAPLAPSAFASAIEPANSCQTSNKPTESVTLQRKVPCQVADKTIGRTPDSDNPKSELAQEEVCPVGQLNDLKVKIEAKIVSEGLDAAAVRGQIGLKTGKLLAFINASTPDDPVMISKLKAAAKEVLKLNL
jgi:hypothetical protein